MIMLAIPSGYYYALFATLVVLIWFVKANMPGKNVAPPSTEISRDEYECINLYLSWDKCCHIFLIRGNEKEARRARKKADYFLECLREIEAYELGNSSIYPAI